MRTWLLAAPFIVVSTAFAQQGLFPAPIEPAGIGKLQCHSPDHQRKTCESLAEYRPAADGNFENEASVELPGIPGVVMQIRLTVRVREGSVCGYIRKWDIDKASFIVNGEEADAAMTTDIRQRVTALYEPMFDHELCSSYETVGAELLVRSRIDGLPAPSVSHAVVWVSPDDGWKVR